MRDFREIVKKQKIEGKFVFEAQNAKKSPAAGLMKENTIRLYQNQSNSAKIAPERAEKKW